MRFKKTLLLLIFIGILSISMISWTSANYGDVRSLAVVPGMDPSWFPAVIHNPEMQAAFIRVFADYDERVISFWTIPGPFDSHEALGFVFGWYVVAENQLDAMQAHDETDAIFYIQKDGESSWTLISDDKTPIVRMAAFTKALHDWDYLPNTWEIYSYREGGAFKPDTLTPGWYTIRIVFYYLNVYDGHFDLVFEFT